MNTLATRIFVGLAAFCTMSLTIGGGRSEAMTTLMGGRTLGTTDSMAARAQIGWPGLELTWAIPVIESFDVSPKFGLSYGRNLRAGLVGLAPGAEIRWNVFNAHAFSLALEADLAMVVSIPTDGKPGSVGMRLPIPGVVGSYQLAPEISLFGALRTPIWIAFEPTAVTRLPLVFDAGVEVLTSRSEDLTVNLTGQLSLGPEFCLSGCSRTEIFAHVSLGAAVIW